MKYLAVIALALFGAAMVAAAPEAEAEAEAYYGRYGGYGGYGYGGYSGYGGSYYGNGYGRAGYGHAYGYGSPSRYYGYRSHGLYKREAEAEPEAHYYGAYAGAYAPFGYNYSPYHTYAYAAPHASSFQQVNTPAASYGIRQLHKREAEAEPEAHYYGAYAGAYAPFGYNYSPYQTYAYAAPHASSFQQVNTPAASYGIRQLHKREAEAEPEAEAYYGAYGYPGVAGHPGVATSYSHRSVQGASYNRGFYGYPAYGFYGYRH